MSFPLAKKHIVTPNVKQRRNNVNFRSRTVYNKKKDRPSILIESNIDTIKEDEESFLSPDNIKESALRLRK